MESFLTQMSMLHSSHNSRSARRAAMLADVCRELEAVAVNAEEEWAGCVDTRATKLTKCVCHTLGNTLYFF